MTTVPKEFVYDGSSEGLRQVYEFHPRGTAILCPKCRSQLIVALDLEAANRHKVHPGLYCPLDANHMTELLSLAEVHRKVFEIFSTSKGGPEEG